MVVINFAETLVDLLNLVADLCHNHLCLVADTADLLSLEAVDLAATSVAVAIHFVDPQCSVAVINLVAAMDDLLNSVAAAVLLGHLCMAEASVEVSVAATDSAVVIDSVAAISLVVDTAVDLVVVDLLCSAVDFQAWAVDLEVASQVWVAVWVEALEAIHSAADLAVDVVTSAVDVIHFKVAG
jgi:hypothetical protein